MTGKHFTLVIVGFLLLSALALWWILSTDARWQQFKKEHQCVDTGEKRLTLISVKPIMFIEERLYRCNDGLDHWGT